MMPTAAPGSTATPLLVAINPSKCERSIDLERPIDQQDAAAADVAEPRVAPLARKRPSPSAPPNVAADRARVRAPRRGAEQSVERGDRGRPRRPPRRPRRARASAASCERRRSAASVPPTATAGAPAPPSEPPVGAEQQVDDWRVGRQCAGQIGGRSLHGGGDAADAGERAVPARDDLDTVGGLRRNAHVVAEWRRWKNCRRRRGERILPSSGVPVRRSGPARRRSNRRVAGQVGKRVLESRLGDGEGLAGGALWCCTRKSSRACRTAKVPNGKSRAVAISAVISAWPSSRSGARAAAQPLRRVTVACCPTRSGRRSAGSGLGTDREAHDDAADERARRRVELAGGERRAVGADEGQVQAGAGHVVDQRLRRRIAWRAQQAAAIGGVLVGDGLVGVVAVAVAVQVAHHRHRIRRRAAQAVAERAGRTGSPRHGGRRRSTARRDAPLPAPSAAASSTSGRRAAWCA